MGLFLQLIIRGIVAGTVYALLGVSWGIIYSTTRTFHFAHGFIYTAAAYVIVLLTMDAGFPLIIALMSGLLSAIILGCACEAFAYRPLREKGGTQLAIFLTAMGIMILGENIIHIGFGPNPRPLNVFEEIPIFWGPVTFTTLDIMTVAACWGAMVALLLFLKYTKLGKIIRAVSSNPEKAISVGIDVKKAFLLVFGIGSVLMAWGAFFATLNTPATPFMGIPVLLMAFIAAFLGGVGSTNGAIFGGLVIGLAETLSLFFIPAQYKLIISFVILFVVVILKPEGLLGSLEEIKR